MWVKTGAGMFYSNNFGIYISDFGYDFDCPLTPGGPIKCT